MISKIIHYYFDDKISINDLDLNILLNEKSYKFFLIYHVAYKNMHDARLLCDIFDKVDGFINKYDGTKYLALFHSNKK